jgi:hypothetical protein
VHVHGQKDPRIKTSIGWSGDISGRHRGGSQPQPYRLASDTVERQAREGQARPGQGQLQLRRSEIGRPTKMPVSGRHTGGKISDIAPGLDSGANLRQHSRESRHTSVTLLQISCYEPVWPHGLTVLVPNSSPHAAARDTKNRADNCCLRNMTSSCQARRAREDDRQGIIKCLDDQRDKPAH